MHPDLHLVLKLQDLDQRIVKLDKEIAALPKHIAQIEKALDAHNRRLEADRAALAANQKERKQREGDIQLIQQKMSKIREQTLQAKTNEQYKAFTSEISHFEREVRKAEDRILELMGEAEPLEANVKKAEVALKAEKAQVGAEKKEARERTAVDQKAHAEATAERKDIAANVPPDTLALYNRARRKSQGGSGTSEVVEGRCVACFILLRPQLYQIIRANEKVLACENCSRVLYYNPPVSFETEMADRQVS